MNGDIDTLEQKLEQVLAMCGQMRMENRALHDQIAGLLQRNQLLMSRADAARKRLEVLADRLPTE